MIRFDERDTLFARMAYAPGTLQYEDYYSRNPDKKTLDDTLRNMPKLCSEESRFYDPVKCAIVESNFSLLEELHPLCESKLSQCHCETSRINISRTVKKILLDFGVDSVRIAKMREEFYYSHRGRHPQHYGKPVDELIPFGIVFSVRMEKEMINAAPDVDEMVESSSAYLRAAFAGLALMSVLRNMGYSARNHMDGNYLAVLPHVAESAGLGVFGRSGLVITHDSGPAVKLGLVTTDLPLEVDSPLSVNLEEFCEECRRCSDRCPSSAIPKGSKKFILGTRRWKFDSERCYAFWREAGTDCGLCIKNCPFTDEVALSDFI